MALVLDFDDVVVVDEYGQFHWYYAHAVGLKLEDMLDRQHEDMDNIQPFLVKKREIK